MKIDSIEIRHYRLDLDPPFQAAWNPNPRRTFTNTLVRVRAGEHEGPATSNCPRLPAWV
jgi:hypothetical protein